MNIQQIKTDLAAGVIVSPATWRKLVEAALMQQEAILKAVHGSREYCEGAMEDDLYDCLKKVEEL